MSDVQPGIIGTMKDVMTAHVALQHRGRRSRGNSCTCAGPFKKIIFKVIEVSLRVLGELGICPRVVDHIDDVVHDNLNTTLDQAVFLPLRRVGR